MLHQKMIGWPVRKWRDADQPKQLQLNHLAQRTTHVEVGELVWIPVANAAPLQAKNDAFKKAVFADSMYQRLPEISDGGRLICSSLIKKNRSIRQIQKIDKITEDSYV